MNNETPTHAGFSIYTVYAGIEGLDSGDNLTIIAKYGQFITDSDAMQALWFMHNNTSKIKEMIGGESAGIVNSDEVSCTFFAVRESDNDLSFVTTDFDFIENMLLSDYEKRLITAYNDATGKSLPINKESLIDAEDAHIDSTDPEDIVAEVCEPEYNRLPDLFEGAIDWEIVLDTIMDEDVVHAEVECEDFYFRKQQ